MSFLIRTTLLILLICLYGCITLKGKEKPQEPILKLLVAISYGGCSSKCPQYDAEFYSGQKLNYKGHSRMPLIGHYSYLIPKQLTTNLLADATKLKIAELNDSIPSETGEQRIKIRFQLPDGKLKTVSAGNKSGPASFLEFAKKIHAEVSEMVANQEGVKMP
jgi:hypothetical protein